MNRFRDIFEKVHFRAILGHFGQNPLIWAEPNFSRKIVLSLFYVHGPLTSRKRQKINDVNAMQCNGFKLWCLVERYKFANGLRQARFLPRRSPWLRLCWFQLKFSDSSSFDGSAQCVIKLLFAFFHGGVWLKKPGEGWLIIHLGL